MGLLLFVLSGLWLLLWGGASFLLFLLNSGNLAFLIFVFIASPPMFLYLLFTVGRTRFMSGESQAPPEDYGRGGSGWMNPFVRRGLVRVANDDVVDFWAMALKRLEEGWFEVYRKLRDGRDTSPVNVDVFDMAPQATLILYHITPALYDGVHDLFIEFYPKQGDFGKIKCVEERVGLSWGDKWDLVMQQQLDKYGGSALPVDFWKSLMRGGG